MTQLIDDFDFRDAHFYQSKADPLTIFYVPGEPEPETAPSGKPMLNLWVSDQGAILQFSTRWEVPAEALGALRQRLADQYADLNLALIRFTPAPVTLAAVTLTLGDGNGKEEVLQSVTSSNFPPYAALFNVTLTAAQAARVTSALNGRTGLLKVTYQGTQEIEVAAQTSIEGDLPSVMGALDETASFADCMAQIEAALGDGRLQLSRSGADAAPDERREKADRLAKEKVADLLCRAAHHQAPKPDSATLKASVSLKDTVSLPFHRAADMASWVADATQHLSILPTTQAAAPAPRIASLIRVGFDMKEVPIAFIQATSGQTQATLRAPVFSPAALVAETDKPIIIKTNYTDGGAPYETELSSPPAMAGWVLTPQDLGLALLVIDASARREAGAAQAQIQVTYKPSGNGSADEHLIHLRYGDWTASWYVITRSNGLDGTLEIELKETIADGSVVKHPAVITAQPEVKL